MAPRPAGSTSHFKAQKMTYAFLEVKPFLEEIPETQNLHWHPETQGPWHFSEFQKPRGNLSVPVVTQSTKTQWRLLIGPEASLATRTGN